jgi:hypothetical protein
VQADREQQAEGEDHHPDAVRHPLEPSDRRPPRLLHNFSAVVPVPGASQCTIERTVAILCERWVGIVHRLAEPDPVVQAPQRRRGPPFPPAEQLTVC